GLLREVLPKPGTVAFVIDPNNDSTPFQIQEMQAAAQAVGQPLLVIDISTEGQIDKAFAAMAERNVAAILYGATPVFQVVSERLAAVAGRYPVAGLFERGRFVHVRGLVRYPP